jgi:hypothetical protein
MRHEGETGEIPPSGLTWVTIEDRLIVGVSMVLAKRVSNLSSSPTMAVMEDAAYQLGNDVLNGCESSLCP